MDIVVTLLYAALKYDVGFHPVRNPLISKIKPPSTVKKGNIE